MSTVPSPAAGLRDLGEYLRQQRMAANMSVRQLSALTGISNPYLSQIERGLRRPSAEILQQLAQGLSLSAESLYVRAGLLDRAHAPYGADSRAAIRTDPHLDGAQRRALLDAYARVVGSRPNLAVDSAADDTDAVRSHRTSHDNEEKSMNAKSGRRTIGLATDSTALTPIYAVVGASDLAVEKLRELGAKATKDAEQGLDDLQHRAEHDVAKVVAGARQVPQLALTQALEVVARGRQQYDELAARGKKIDLPAQAATTAVGLMKQATDLVGRSRIRAEHVVDRAEHVVEQGRTQAEHIVEHGRTQAVRSLDETRRAADRTRRAAVQQAGQVVDQAAHVVDAVTHVGRTPVTATVTVTPAPKPLARRRRSPGATRPATTPEATEVTEASRTVAGAGVEAGSTAATKPAKKAATKKAASRTVAGTAPAAKRAAKRTPAKAKVAVQVDATPADMPAVSSVPLPPAAEIVEPKPATPSAQLPVHKED